MTITWSDQLNTLSKPPNTIAEAVKRLMAILSSDEKQYIAAMDENDLFGLHFSLGLEIRNAFGLHNPDSRLLANCGTAHPDDAAGMIVKEVWNKLTTE